MHMACHRISIHAYASYAFQVSCFKGVLVAEQAAGNINNSPGVITISEVSTYKLLPTLLFPEPPPHPP